MAKLTNTINPEKKKQIRLIVIIGGICLLLMLLLLPMFSGDSEADDQLATFRTQKGPLTISVLESGTIKAKEQIIIKNEVEGRTSIIYLIEEGQKVKEGDLLVELDSSNLLDDKLDQEIRVQNAEAADINAKENLAVVENQAQSDIDRAELTLKFAKQDLDQYINGIYPNDLKAAVSQIRLAEEELKRAQETLQTSQELYDEQYISLTELQADQLAEQRKQLSLDLTKADRQLLENFTYQRQIAQLESDVQQADMALERTRRKANADVIQAKAQLKAKEAEFQRQKEKLAKIEDQITKTKIFAPADGLVIYATSAKHSWRSSTEPLDEGQQVHERQELIYLPVGSTSIAEVRIHEASLKKVRLGLPAVITVDALPGQQFLGKIQHIAPLPDAQSMFMNPDLKVYRTEILLDGELPQLRTGMSSKVEIIVEQYDEALYIPIQSVLLIGGVPTVYTLKGDRPEERQVEIGMDNNRMIHILSGLKEKERVLLTPPLKSASLEAVESGGPSQQRGGLDEGLNRQIRSQLEQSRSSANQKASGNAESSEPQRPEQGRNLTPEQREQMRKRLESMPSEQKEKLRKQYENMTPEQRKQMRQQRQRKTPQE